MPKSWTWFQLYYQLPLLISVLGFIFCLLKRSMHQVWESLNSLLCHLVTRLSAQFVIPLALFMPWIDWAYQSRAFHLPFSWQTVILYFLFAELWFYVTHYLSHHIAILWSAHSVHHSGTSMNYALIARSSPLEIVAAAVLTVPVILVGFDSEWFRVFYFSVFVHQSFCHTEANWPRFLDSFLMTPRLHRIHHSNADENINRNFGGITCIWDRLFGTYCEEQVGMSYGLASGLRSYNPLVVLVAAPWEILKVVWRTKNPIYFIVFPRRAI